MERGRQESSGESSQAAEEERNQLSEKKRVIVAMTRILGSGALGEESLRLLEQLADCIQRPRPEVTREAEPVRQVTAQQITPAGGEPVETKPTEMSTGEPISDGDSERNAEEGVIVGSLRTMSADRWTCRVPSCTGGFHRLKDCRQFLKMDPEDRFKLVDLHSLCLGCLTPGHGRAARSCPYEEERADGCKRTACRRRHHHLLHMEERKAKKGSGKSPPARPLSPLEDPTPTKDLGCEIQLVAQWVSTKGGVPALVFWDTGSQVTLISQKMALALGLVAIPSSPLRLEGIGEGHRPWAATRFKVPLVDTGGRVITVTAYGVDVIMSPLTGGDVMLMRETFPEVPAGGLVSAAGEVSLLMGQDNLSLFPAKRRRVGNAALYMSRFGTRWIASGRPPRVKSGGSTRLVGVCVVRTPDYGMANQLEPQEEDAAICAVSTVVQKWTAPPLHVEGGIFQPYDFLTSESLGTDLPRRCTSCRKCKECKFRTDSLTFKEDQEYQVILEGLEFNKERRKWRAMYPFHIPPTTRTTINRCTSTPWPKRRG
jgi:hypothetical protein